MPKRHMSAVYLDFLAWGFDERGWTHRTRALYFSTIRRADDWLRTNRRRRITAATTKDLKAFLATTSPSPKTRNNYASALLAWGCFLVDAGLRDANPAAGLPKLREQRPLPKALSPKDAQAVIDVACTMGAQTEALVKLLVYGGLRHTEARTLEWGQFDSEFAWVTFVGKGTKERTVPLHPLARAALHAWRAQNSTSRWVFPSPMGGWDKPMSMTHFWKIVKRVGDIAGLEGLHPHVLRHTAATRLVEQGSDLPTVQQYLGHSSLQATSIYLRVRPSRLQDAVARLDYETKAETQRSGL